MRVGETPYIEKAVDEDSYLRTVGEYRLAQKHIEEKILELISQ